MPVNPKSRAKVQGYVPLELKKRMVAVTKLAPYFTVSMQIMLALEARIGVMEDRVGVKERMR
jgi:hypothetical protein